MLFHKDLSKDAGVIKIVSDSEIYYGYPNRGVTGRDVTGWNIIQAKLTSDTWEFKCAEGKLDYSNTFDDYDQYTYYWPK